MCYQASTTYLSYNIYLRFYEIYHARIDLLLLF
jgi:hypothetical protein